MPVGSLSVYPEIVRLVLLNNPKRILDLGIGNGMNGAGIRNWYGWECELIGVDGWEGYCNGMWDVYSKVFVMNIEEYIKKDEKFDFIVMTDVIEHFNLIDGYGLINRLKEMLNPNGVLLISTPAIWFEQGAYMGNELERHRSFWTNANFEECGMTPIGNGDPCNYGHKMILAEYLNR